MENDDPNHTSVFQVCQYHTIFLFIVILYVETYIILMRYKYFQHLVKSGEVKSWAEYNLQKLKTIISPPLSNAKEGVQDKYKRLKMVESTKTSNEETLSLMETKTALAKLMTKNIQAKQRIETRILKTKLIKEKLAVKLLKMKCRKMNRGEPISSNSDSMLSSESSEEVF
ncbi:PREDICTED: uncharacterized protein LOC105562984 [Vollenhovia emeryi]|uniref:uncharacterized protein LOC105562984 n=1 Tax=Vollenhovia emeryi TaxID=411798 RepID=UPI0005F47EBD|nr:PREDICTED: uncharacterized protein LOC105562984 [Vollenhovia emeryi]